MLGSGKVRRSTTLVWGFVLWGALLVAPAHAGSESRKARLIGLAAGTALGGVFAATEGSSDAPRLDQPGVWDLALTAGSIGAMAVAQKEAPCRGIACCRWCDAKDGQPHVNRLDGRVAQALRWSDRNRADRWSDVALGASLGQALGYTSLGNRTAALRDVALLGESYALTLAVTQVTKKIARRPRPYAHREDAPPGTDIGAEEARVSFFSGHASSTFCLAVATGTLAFARHEKNAGWVLGSGLAIAATTGYLRMAGDRHYLTDVVVGAVVGSAAGFLVPHLHRPSAPPPSVQAAAPGRRAGVTVPLSLGRSRQGAVTASYSDGPSLTVHLAW